MIARLTISLAIASYLALGAGAEPEWLEIDAKPLDWLDSLPMLNPKHSVLVLDMPSATHLRGFAAPSPKKPVFAEAVIREQVAGLFETSRTQENVDLKIEWLSGDEQPVDFTRAIQPKAGMIRSSYRLGDAKVTRTVVTDEADSAIFIHLITDHPGMLSFRVALSVSDAGQTEIVDRRQLVRPATVSLPNSLGAHVWVLPFESDVAPDGKSIVVRGEGEALVILTFANGSEAGKPLAETLARLGNRHDPGHHPADPSKIWQGVLAGHLKSIENSP